MRFGEKASVYDEWATPQRRSADWVAEWIEADCSGLRGIEMGAGTGVFTRWLAKRGFEDFAAVEKSRRMAKEGQKHFPECDWLEGDAWTLRVAPVDRIYSSSLLQWANDPLTVLKNWRRLLTEGGRLLCGIYTSGSLARFQEIDPMFSAFDWRSGSEWATLFSEAGFRVSRNEEQEDSDHFANAREALLSIHEMGAIEEKRWSPGRLRSFLNACDSRYPKGFDVSWRTLRIEATAIS